MQKLFLILIALTAFSCKNEEKKEPLYPEQTVEESTAAEPVLNASETLGLEIFEGKGNCFACHKTDQKIIGPSVMDIARIYKEKNGDIKAFLKGKADPLVDPSQYEVMKANLLLTKEYTDEELKGLEDYISSTVKQK